MYISHIDVYGYGTKVNIKINKEKKIGFVLVFNVI